MIRIKVEKENSRYKKFMISGHAGYAEEGEDIICAAVSALVINTINSIEEFTEDAFTCDCKDGQIQNWEFTGTISDATTLLMDSLMLGLCNIEKAYGTEYISVKKTNNLLDRGNGSC